MSNAEQPVIPETLKSKEHKIIISVDEDGKFITLEMIRKESEILADSWYWEEHPENFNDACLCDTCDSYGDG